MIFQIFLNVYFLFLFKCLNADYFCLIWKVILAHFDLFLFSSFIYLFFFCIFCTPLFWWHREYFNVNCGGCFLCCTSISPSHHKWEVHRNDWVPWNLLSSCWLSLSIPPSGIVGKCGSPHCLAMELVQAVHWEALRSLAELLLPRLWSSLEIYSLSSGQCPACYWLLGFVNFTCVAFPGLSLWQVSSLGILQSV